MNLWGLEKASTMTNKSSIKFSSMTFHHSFKWFVAYKYVLGSLNLVSTIEELLGRKGSSSSLENREYRIRDPSRWPRDTLYLKTLALTSPTCDGRTVGIVRLRAQSFLAYKYENDYWQGHI
jgi:hypothetical protein